MSTPISVEPALKGAITASVATLRRLASYQLPAEFDRRILDLGERKETLTSDEHAELLAWVAFTQERSAEKLEAEMTLHRLAVARPELATRA